MPKPCKIIQKQCKQHPTNRPICLKTSYRNLTTTAPNIMPKPSQDHAKTDAKNTPKAYQNHVQIIQTYW